MKRLLILCACMIFTRFVFAQRSMAIITPSPYSLFEQMIIPSSLFNAKIHLPVSSIHVIDNRFDTTKQGFYPVFKSAPRLIRFPDHLSLWMQNWIDNLVSKDSTSNRRLTMVIQRFWFGYSANQKFNFFKQHLETSLYYKIEFFSSVNDSTYPIRRSEGVITTLFNEQDTYKALLDSLSKNLAADFEKIDFNLKESRNAISSEQLNDYVRKKNEKLNLRRPLKKGVYATHNDFLQQKILGDSVDLVRYNDYFNRQMVACHIGVYLQNSLQPCNKCWGYFDGRFLFYNTGNGLFVKLTPWFNQFILADLQQVVFSKKRKSFVSEATVSASSYNIIKDFAKVFHLFFQLDFEDGKIY